MTAVSKGEGGRARQQGSNILGRFPGGQAIRSKLTRRCATHNLLVRHESEARTRKATRFVRVAMGRLKTETRRDSPPDMSHACLGLGLGSPRGHSVSGSLGQVNSSEVLGRSWTAAAAATLRRTIPKISSPRLDSKTRERAITCTPTSRDKCRRRECATRRLPISTKT